MRPRLEMKHALAEIEHRALRGMRHRHLDRPDTNVASVINSSFFGVPKRAST